VPDEIRTQIRCRVCHRRLADVTNNIEVGSTTIEVKCPRCRTAHLEVLTPE
jgi:phage FluMu protein Com